MLMLKQEDVDGRGYFYLELRNAGNGNLEGISVFFLLS
jgi:hypothetical protein